MAAVGVTGTSAANRLAEEADVVLAVGTRLQDFTTGSWALFKNDGKTIIGLNVQPFDAGKHRALPLVADAREGLEANWQRRSTAGRRRPPGPTTRSKGKAEWQKAAAKVDRRDQCRAAFRCAGDRRRAARAGQRRDAAACRRAACRASCTSSGRPARPAPTMPNTASRRMGYEIAGGLGVKMAKPDEEVVVMLGDGSYLMLNSEIATSVMLGLKLTIVLLDNRGFGCINRLQMAHRRRQLQQSAEGRAATRCCPTSTSPRMPRAWARSPKRWRRSPSWKRRSARPKENDRTTVIVIDTDPLVSTEAGGHWWDVAVPEVSARKQVNAARKAYEEALKLQRVGRLDLPRPSPQAARGWRHRRST